MCESNRDIIRAAIDECLSGTDGRPSIEGRVLSRVRGERRAPLRLSAALAVALLITLLAAAALAVGALTGLFHLVQEDVGALRGCVSMGDTLCLMTTDGLYAWRPGEEEPTPLASSEALGAQAILFEAPLYRDGDAVGILLPEAQTVWRYEGGKLTRLLDYAGTEMALASGLRYTSAAYQDGWLFLRAMPENASETEALLYRANPRTGEAALLPISGVIELCAYELGGVLAIQRDGAAGEDRLLLLDAETGAPIETLYTAPEQGLAGLAYSPERGELYALVGGTLSRWDGGGLTALQGYAPHHLADAFAVVGDGYVSVSYGDMQYVPFAEKDSLATLTIRGYIATDNADADFQSERAGVAVVRDASPSLNAADVRSAIEAGDTTDLFHLRLEGDVYALFEEGAVAPLSASEALMADAREMLPTVQEGLFANGELYAVPSCILVLGWRAADGSVPATWRELIRRQAEWTGEAPFLAWNREGGAWTKRDYADALLTAYIAEEERTRGEVSFRNGAFADALAALKALELSSSNGDVSAVAVTPGVAVSLAGEPPEDVGWGESRVYPSEPSDALASEEPGWGLPPAVNASAPHDVPAQLIVYVLNPNARNPELAKAYLAFRASSRAAGDEALLKPDVAQPALHPHISSWLDGFVEEQRAFDAERGVETKEADLQRRMDAILAEPDSWAVTPNRLALYREQIAPCLDLRLSPLLSRSARADGGRYRRMLEAVMAYVEGDGELEACLGELERMAAGE